MLDIFTILECRYCKKTFKIKSEKIVARNANIQCPSCGIIVNNSAAVERYYQSINDFKKRLSGVK